MGSPVLSDTFQVHFAMNDGPGIYEPNEMIVFGKPERNFCMKKERLSVKQITTNLKQAQFGRVSSEECNVLFLFLRTLVSPLFGVDGVSDSRRFIATMQTEDTISEGPV